MTAGDVAVVVRDLLVWLSGRLWCGVYGVNPTSELLVFAGVVLVMLFALLSPSLQGLELSSPVPLGRPSNST